MPGLNREAEAAVEASLDRLAGSAGKTLCLAVSGGSDSMALAGLAAGWARRTGGQVIGLTVDHGLQAGSDRVAAQTVRQLAAIGIEGRILAWNRAAPLLSGVQTRARAARHRLLAQAASSLGSRIVVMAHTADDLAETVLFRLARDTGPLGLVGMEPLSVSPQWPHAEGTLVARPMLGLRRAALRDWLQGRQIGWHDDPANQNTAFARVRMRAALSGCDGNEAHDRLIAIARAGGQLRTALRAWLLDWLAAHTRTDGQSLELDPQWAALPPALATQVLAITIAAVAGLEGSIRHDKVAALLARLAGGRATLAGTVLTPAATGLTISPAPPRKRACGAAGAALHLPLAVRIAHLAGDCNTILSRKAGETFMDTKRWERPEANHSFVRHRQGMVSAGRYPIL
jgi:tRNA(Ile)-lysidine synthase